MDRAIDVIHWNQRLMSTLGLWPLQRNNLLFFIDFGYFCGFMILECLDLILHVSDLEYVVMNLTESMQYSQIFCRISVLWRYNDQLNDLIGETLKDFDDKKYKTVDEKRAFLTYNARSKIFIKFILVFIGMIVFSYYLTPILALLTNGFPSAGMDVNQTIYTLPYHFYVFYPINNIQTYVSMYAFELPFAFITGFGQTAADCIMVTLVFHICGQMSVLALRITNMNVEACNSNKEIRSIIRMHTRLLRMSKKVENAFSTALLAHLVGATVLICIVGYQILMNFDNGEKANLFTFLVYQVAILLTLYAHCVVGESLVTESANVCKAFYECEWYNMSNENARLIVFCIARSQKTLCLSAGKFNTFCLCTLTDEENNLDRAANVISWIEWLLTAMGLWPHRRNNILFLFNYGYFCIFMILQYLDLFFYIDNFEHVIMNLTENLQFSQIFVRVTMLWRHNEQLGIVIAEAMKDFDDRKYKSVNEKKAFLTYNVKSKILAKSLAIFVSLSASSYYLTPTLNVLSKSLLQFETNRFENQTKAVYTLPYHLYVAYPMRNTQTYIITYILEFPFVIISVFGQIAADCTMIMLTFHICGQLSVLALRITNINTESYECKEQIRSIIRAHSRLIGMSENIGGAFSITLLVHLIGVTTLMCILGYQILLSLESGEKGNLLTFLTFQFAIMIILYAHCTIGESLVTESTRICDAFYECKWYNMSTKNIKLLVLCIARSQKSLRLTAGKFNTFCLDTLTNVLKTSMGYLSVLRSLL